MLLARFPHPTALAAALAAVPCMVLIADIVLAGQLRVISKKLDTRAQGASNLTPVAGFNPGIATIVTRDVEATNTAATGHSLSFA